MLKLLAQLGAEQQVESQEGLKRDRPLIHAVLPRPRRLESQEGLKLLDIYVDAKWRAEPLR